VKNEELEKHRRGEKKDGGTGGRGDEGRMENEELRVKSEE
jgi:hypothetical protein